jgi:hypothetical protein
VEGPIAHRAVNERHEESLQHAVLPSQRRPRELGLVGLQEPGTGADGGADRLAT